MNVNATKTTTERVEVKIYPGVVLRNLLAEWKRSRGLSKKHFIFNDNWCCYIDYRGRGSDDREVIREATKEEIDFMENYTKVHGELMRIYNEMQK